MPVQHIVIVGGGSTGLLILKKLVVKYSSDTNIQLILVNPNPYFAYLPGSARLVVSNELDLDRVLIPFPERFHEGNRRHIQAKVVSITDDGDERYVILDNGDKLDFAVLVLTPGCIWEGALEFADKKAEEARASIRTWRSRFEKAENIVLVGGGGVGVEMSGEIMDEWPTKHVTIIHGPRLLLNDAYPDRWRKYVAAGIQKRGVHVVLNDRVDSVEPKEGVITTRSGKTIPADLVVPTYGPRPNTQFISDSLGSDSVNAWGFVKVLPSFQVPKHPRIFAAGDAIDWDEQKSARKSTYHAKIVAVNVSSIINDAEAKLKVYKGAPNNLLLTNGRNGGTMYIDVLWGIITGNWFARIVMSTHLQLEGIKRKMVLLPKSN